MPERLQPLDIVRARLARGNWLDVLRGDILLPGRKRMERILSNAPSTARSEIVVTPEQTSLLWDKVSRIVGWLKKNGQPGTLHPDYEVWLDDGISTPEQMTQMRWYQDDSFEMTTEEYVEGDDDSFVIHHPALHFITEDKDNQADIAITIGHSNFYELEAEFEEQVRAEDIPRSVFDQLLADQLLAEDLIDKETLDDARNAWAEYIAKAQAEGRIIEMVEDGYYSAVRPIEEMTDEEYLVIMHYLNQFMQAQNI